MPSSIKKTKVCDLIMSEYKCEHCPDTQRNANQVLDLVCLGCMKAWIARHDKMLEFIKEIANDNSRVFIDLDDQAKDLLKEIGEE